MPSPAQLLHALTLALPSMLCKVYGLICKTFVPDCLSPGLTAAVQEAHFFGRHVVVSTTVSCSET